MNWSRRRKDIVVATPRRLRDLLNEQEFALAHTQLLRVVLDEADSLLDMDFRDDSDTLSTINTRTTEVLFLATASSAIRQVAGGFVVSYVWMC